MSTLGPIVTVADVNQDGNDDFYVGGSMGESGMIYLGTSTGKFTMSSQAAFELDKGYEDGAAVFFDADGDEDMDLYVASGGMSLSEEMLCIKIDFISITRDLSKKLA